MTATATRSAVRPRLGRHLTIAALVVGAGWGLVLVVWPEAPFTLTFDDAYYYFGIARNVADGQGSTFDGINATNGYHPLWLMLSVPVFAVGLDGMDAVRALLGIQVALYTGALVVLARVVGRAVGGWSRLARSPRADDRAGPRAAEVTVVAAFVLLTANPFVVKTFANGLESGISVLLYALLLARVVGGGPTRFIDASPRWRSVTGLLLLCCFLARTDAALLAGCLGLWALVEAKDRPPRETLTALSELLVPVAVGIVGYLVFNQVAFETPMQVSGLHKRADLDGPRVITLVLLVGLAAFIGVRTWQADHARGRRPSGRFPLTTAAVRHTGWYATFCVLLVAYYNALQVQQWLWYYAPLAVYALLLAPLVVADFAQSTLLEAPRETSAQRALAPIQAILLLPLVVAFGLQVRSFADPDLRSIQVANRAAGEWIGAELPPDAVLASWDAGVVGYFADRPVVNLDGVVNSYEYYEAAQEGRVAEFLADAGVGYTVNHGDDVDGEDPTIRTWLAATFGDEVAEGAEVVQVVPFTFSGSTKGSAGRESGTRDKAVFVYELPPLEVEGP